MGPICGPETSVSNNLTRRYNPEDERIHLLLIGRFWFDTRWNNLRYSEMRRYHQQSLQILLTLNLNSHACKRHAATTYSNQNFIHIYGYSSVNSAEVKLQVFTQPHYTHSTAISSYTFDLLIDAKSRVHRKLKFVVKTATARLQQCNPSCITAVPTQAVFTLRQTSRCVPAYKTITNTFNTTNSVFIYYMFRPTRAILGCKTLHKTRRLIHSN